MSYRICFLQVVEPTAQIEEKTISIMNEMIQASLSDCVSCFLYC